MSLFGTKKKESSRRSSVASNSSSSCKESFASFDEKKDYVRRCSLKKHKSKPQPYTFCLGK
ncbi:uncharacterized protein SPAPADRAFT_59641 [Spathaspora passalidarum NRRL Y-27907]|uniref:Uncharacterized protein n=1 Tax=Spathaspora passalidarum (strain NRRL Y-27907 / 11-Y1) TaxID=619300 RepID=G3AHP4_SPAPN|nr:uncharacterized protein SPAPADRAFT_59641 [Spathaspora passalidarum NRRL Y-27907]EGW34208.1 hypothetical protein SPAPADRAFT_59641 [Spathaspora passalidarum NRRL Y-27907]